MIYIPGRIPIRIHPLFWGLALFIGWMYTQTVAGTAVCVVVILLSLLIHEFGHALSAIAFGQDASVHLLAFGGLTTRRGPPLRPWQEFLVILSGPMSGFIAFALAFFVRGYFPNLPPLSSLAVAVFLFINLYWNALNLLPLIPLDGGRLMSIIFEGLFGLRGLQLSLLLSLIFSVSLCGLLLYTGMHLGGILVLIFAFESFRDLLGSRLLSPKDRGRETAAVYAAAQKLILAGNLSEAVPILEGIRQETGRGLYHLRASVDLASLLAHGGEPEKAYHYLQPVQRQLDTEALQLFHELAFKMGEWKEAIAAGVRSHREIRHFGTAFNIAVCHAHIGEFDSMLGWLQRARQDGMPQLRAALERADFDLHRSDSRFKEFRQGLEH